MDLSVLRGVLKLAKLWKRVADEYKPLPEKDEGIGRALTDEEERLLFDIAASKEVWQVAFYAAVAAANTSMRGDEIKKLRIRDVDLENSVIRITRSKTNAGRRNIPLNGPALWAFKRLRERAFLLGATCEITTCCLSPEIASSWESRRRARATIPLITSETGARRGVH